MKATPSRRKKGRRPRFIAIYEIKCIYINKVYIGSSRDVCMRWNSHTWDLLMSKHVCQALRDEVKVRGIDSITFRVLEVLPLGTTPKEVRSREQAYMNTYTREELMNIKRAEGVNKGSKHTVRKNQT